MSNPLAKMVSQKWHPPAPTTESFAGKTILATGATAGLGLEAAKKLAGLRVSKLIITARSHSKGQRAQQEIETFSRAGSTPPAETHAPTTEVIPLILDMSTFAGVQKFAQTLKETVSRLDGAILNAGTLQSQ